MKTCSKCGETKELFEFKKDKTKPDGFYSSCKQCCKKQWSDNYENIASRHREKNKLYARNNKDSVKIYHDNYYQENKIVIQKRVKEWRNDNVGWANFLRTNSKQRYKRAMPPWADAEKMKNFYIEAHELSKKTGIKHSVDHIIPIKGKNVSGLHVETNLQVITLTDNIKKYNKVVSI